MIMLKKKIKINEKIFDLEMEDLKGKFIRIEINGKDYFFRKDNGNVIPVDQRQLLAAEQEAESVFSEVFCEAPKNLRAPLAGMVSNIWAKAGEKVVKGQKLVTVIAMKMENEISASGTGKIKEIKCQPNQAVNKDDILVIFE